VEDRFSEFSCAVDDVIAEMLASPAPYAGLYDMHRYHLGWVDESGARTAAPPGKRLRPALSFLVADAVAGDWRVAVPAAAAVEMIHNFSLIHDDIEDRSALRRFRPTVWARWGEAQGINAGDALLVLAELTLVERAPAEWSLEALRLLNRTCRALCEGQYLDLLWEREPTVTLAQYLDMIERKTARLFRASAELGALAGRASAESQELFGEFGGALGMAFQVLDDFLGAWAPALDTGKTAGLDITTRKKALPAILGLASPSSPAKDRFRSLFERDRPLSSEETEEAIALLDVMGIRGQTTRMARRYREDAARILDRLAPLYDVTSLRDFLRVMLPLTDSDA